VALRARPGSQERQSHLDGEVVWKSDAVTGDPIMRVRGGVLVWDGGGRSLLLLDTANGKVRESVSLPDVRSVTASAPTDGDLILLQADGRMQRCSPLDRMPAKQPTAPANVTEPAADTPAEAPDETAEAPAASTSSEPGR
jgi:hypothetical protein